MYPGAGVSPETGLIEQGRIDTSPPDAGFIDGVTIFNTELRVINSAGDEFSMEGDDRTANQWDII